MIILNVVYHAKKGMRGALYEALTPKAEIFRREPGNLCYSYFAACEDEDALLLLEKWESEEALTAHGQTDVFASLGAIKDAYVERMELNKFEC